MTTFVATLNEAGSSCQAVSVGLSVVLCLHRQNLSQQGAEDAQSILVVLQRVMLLTNDSFTAAYFTYPTQLKQWNSMLQECPFL